jgi:hypothetical protein
MKIKVFWDVMSNGKQLPLCLHFPDKALEEKWLLLDPEHEGNSNLSNPRNYLLAASVKTKPLRETQNSQNMGLFLYHF